MPLPATFKSCPRGGFSLIEAAIVLAVVGLVIGGIWIAAAAVNKNNAINNTVDTLFTAVSNMQNLMTMQQSMQLATGYDLIPVAREAGVFPRSWVSGNAIRHPLGGTVTMINQNVGRFDINFNNITDTATCIKIVMRVSSIGYQANLANPMAPSANGRPGLGYVMVNDGAAPHTYMQAFPISLQTAQSECATPVHISFGFGFSRPN